MSTIIRLDAVLPMDMVREIKDYVFDMDIRIAVILQGCLEKDPEFTFANLFRRFTSNQLTTIFMQGGHEKFYRENRYTDTFTSVLPMISYRRGHAVHWTSNQRVFTDTVSFHPISRNIEYYASKAKFGKQKPKQIAAMDDLFHFLCYTEISNKPFDHFVRNMAYQLLAGTLILNKTIEDQKNKKVKKTRTPRGAAAV